MTNAERMDKFYGQALMVVSREQADRIVSFVEKIEEVDDIRPGEPLR